MSDPGTRIDQEASEAIKQIRTQLSLEGKLDDAYACQGAAILFGPLLLFAVFGVLTLLGSIGIDGEAGVFIGAMILVMVILLACYILSNGRP